MENVICRLKCRSCKKAFSILPDFIIPHYQNSLTSVLMIVEDGVAGAP
ncbi:DUF6431 domain-containing protein [Robertmurraya sp. 2P01SA]